MVKVSRLRCEAMVNPIGITISNPRLSWILESEERMVVQKKFRVKVTSVDMADGTGCLVFDSDEVESEDNFIILPDIFWGSGMRYSWSVEITDNKERNWEAKEDAWFEMGILCEADWKAQWIEPKQKPAVRVKNEITRDQPNQGHMIDDAQLRPCPMIRKEFRVKGAVRRARIYATAHGIYRLEVNGVRAGNYELSPEATCYADYLQAQAYDITNMLAEGDNVIGAVLADGWWAGRLGNFGDSVQYGDKLALLLQIHMIYEDGTEEIIGTDETFESSESPRRYADLCIGEKYDMHYERKGWSEPGYADEEWQQVEVQNYGMKNIVGQNAHPIRVLETIDEINRYVSAKGERILDFGQVMAGNATMTITGQPHAVITLKYFEEPDSDGNYWFELGGRNSQQTDTFILDDTGTGLYDPWFTYHGFRYIYISSDKGDVEAANAEARLIASDVDVTAEIITSNEKVNRLQKNIEWTLRSNMTSILTDNPDRERAGWTGDCQMIMPALCYNLDVQTFMRRWLKEAALEQREDGKVPLVIPNWDTYDQMRLKTSAGWEDAVVIVPWILYERYGDKRILDECYSMMKKWVEYQTVRAKNANPAHCKELTPERLERMTYLWNADFNFGDWLTPSACYNEESGEYIYFTQTLCYMMGTYYYAYTTSIMAKVADILNCREDAQYYKTLNQNIRDAAIEEIYKTGGILESEYMGAQVLALHMGFYPEGEREKLIGRMLELIQERGLDTGFSSTLLISEQLCEYGHHETAYDFLLKEEFPSWLYEVDQNATSVWEAMQAIMPDGTRNAVSFIQPAFCSIGNWMMEGMGGIKPLKPGFKRIEIHPYLTTRLEFVKASYLSVHGEIQCEWKQQGKTVRLAVTVPANTFAVIYLSGADKNNVTEFGKPVCEFEGLVSIEEEQGELYIEVGSGVYLFEYDLDEKDSTNS